MTDDVRGIPTCTHCGAYVGRCKHTGVEGSPFQMVVDLLGDEVQRAPNEEQAAFNRIVQTLPTTEEVMHDLMHRAHEADKAKAFRTPESWAKAAEILAAGNKPEDRAGMRTPATTLTPTEEFSESDWLREAKAALSRRDPLDALRDAEELNRWAHRRWGDMFSHENLEAWLERNRDGRNR